jgi:hypothetical protein
MRADIIAKESYMESADSLEIIANLWYIHDDQGTIYSLRGRLYLASGSDAEKLAVLRGYADVDYLIARPFPIPERLHTTFVLGGEHRKLAVVNRDSLPLLGGEMVLFEEVLQELERQLPAQTPFKISQSPLVCITPLLGTDDGAIKPSFTKRSRLS